MQAVDVSGVDWGGVDGRARTWNVSISEKKKLLRNGRSEVLYADAVATLTCMLGACMTISFFFFRFSPLWFEISSEVTYVHLSHAKTAYSLGASGEIVRSAGEFSTPRGNETGFLKWKQSKSKEAKRNLYTHLLVICLRCFRC